MVVPRLFDGVRETCSAPGIGTVTLLGAAAQSKAFSDVYSSGDTVPYRIQDQNGTNWEVGIGTYTFSLTRTISRDTILSSSNLNSIVNFSSGTQDVISPAPAKMFPTEMTSEIDYTYLSGTFTAKLGAVAKLMLMKRARYR